MACGDVLSLEDLQTAKKHQIFEAEVITGKAGGVAGGASIGTATNPVTGQTQQTLPSILSDLGFDVQSWTSSTGGVLASANQVFLNDTPGSLWLGDYYAWGGTFPKTVPAGTDPALPTSGYIMRSSRFAGTQAREALRRSYAEAGYNMVDGSFGQGGTVTTASDVLLDEASGKAYSRVGGLPHTVSEGSAPGDEPSVWVDRSAEALQGKLAEDYGSSLVNTIQPVPGALKRAVKDALRERISLLDFMTPAQRDAVYSGADINHQSAFTAAMAWLASGSRTLLITSGTYNFTDTFDAPIGSCVIIDPKATLKFTSTTLNVIRIRRGVMFHGNMAKLRMTNPAWDGIAVLFNGEDQFSLEEPCGGSGLDIDSATYKHGTCIHIEAVGPRHYVVFLNFPEWNFGYNMHYGLTFNCGGSGTSDPATWHWITSNTFSDIRSFAFHLISVTGLSATPAEVGGNNLLNVHHQSYDEAGVPMYFSGGHHNTITGFIWDWNNANGSPILFEGGAEWNQIITNVDTSVVKSGGGVDAYRNKVFDHTGGETGQKSFLGIVTYYNNVTHGVVGVAGQYASIFSPDSVGGSVFSRFNDGSALVHAIGNPYSSHTKALSVLGNGTVAVGSSNANTSLAAFRVNGAAERPATTVRVGTDGRGGITFENAAGTQVGFITVDTSSVVYSTSSDYRLKKEVTDISGSGDFIDRLRPVSWLWKADNLSGAGFIAHELKEVSPSSVIGEKDATQEDEEGNIKPIYQGVEYGSSEMIANMVAELQSLRRRVSKLETTGGS